MAAAKDRYAVPEPLLSPKVKDFLGEFQLGRLGLRAGRKIVWLLRRSREAEQRKLWIARFLLPVRNLLFFNRPLMVSLDGVSVSLVPSGAVAGDFWAGLPCQKREAAFIVNLLQPGMIFFDVGTGAGLFSVAAAKKTGADRVFAFEPCASTCHLLKRNFALNRLEAVHVEQIGLGDAAGEGILQLETRGNEGLSTFVHSTRTNCRVAGRENVRVTTVDAFLNEHRIPRVDILRVDVEGAELIVLRGARNLLERADAPDILYQGYGSLTRRFGYHPVEILWFLESYGYTLFSFQSETGEVAPVQSGYQYDSTVIAAKPGSRVHAQMQASLN
jgi:FkbM family methyltransferase